MRGKGRLKATIRDARGKARHALERACQQAEQGVEATPTVKATSDANIVVAGNVGQEGAVRAVSAEQAVAIHQPGLEPRDQDER
jgi:hypothetical protein